MLQNEEVCGNTIYSSSEASGVNHIIFFFLVSLKILFGIITIYNIINILKKR